MSVHNLPLNGHAPNNMDIAKHLLQMAESIATDGYGGVRTVVLLIETEDGELIRNTCGASCDLARAMGLLAIAAARGSTE